MSELLNNNRAALDVICSRFGVARLEAFGSALREDFKEGASDLDLLVEFKSMEPYARVDAYFGLLNELRTMFQREVDLVMVDAVRNPYISREIERTKQLLYAA
jgi:predicted nucleotidyltransferase